METTLPTIIVPETPEKIEPIRACFCKFKVAKLDLRNPSLGNSTEVQLPTA